MITIDRIFAFIIQAMAEDLNINVYNNRIKIRNLDKNVYCIFNILQEEVIVKTKNGSCTVNITLPDYHKLMVIKDDIIKYRENKAVEEFNNFFKEDNKPTDINDLDDKED